MTDKINLYVNSSYRKKDESTTNLKIIVPSGLIKSYGKDFFTLSITSFYCYNTLYQMDENNSDFYVVIRDISGNVYQYLFYHFVDSVGNPNDYNIRDELNSLLLNYISVTYDKVKNLFLYTRTKYNNKEILITTEGIYSYQPINVIYHQQILINIDGDIQMAINNLDNKNSDVLEPTSVLFMKPIDIQRNQLIMYDNWDSNSSFQYKISQKDTINQINIRITNQDNEPIPTLGDWQLTMQLERHDEDITESLLTQIKEYISYLFLIIGTYLS